MSKSVKTEYSLRRMNKVLASLILALIAAPLQAEMPMDAPKLVVGITVDQLRTDYLQMMQRYFGEKGFKRLMNGGVMYETMTFDFPNVDRSSATATIYTGTYPSYHGIISNTFYNVANKRVESILYDPNKMGNYTDEMVSPKNILTSTVCDELKIASDGISRVFSVAPSFEQAILGGGHAANSVFWIDDANGKWASSTHYTDIPIYIEQINTQSSLSKRIDTMIWVPTRPITDYTAMPYQNKDFLFKHIFGRAKHEKYSFFKTSALVNPEITAVASAFIEEGALGQQMFPDFLNVAYSAASYRDKSIQEYSLEIQDTYIRLDRELGKLLDLIDRKIGLQNAVVFLTSTGYFNGEGKELGTFQVPSGEFYPKRAVALLNMYLMAIYGQGDWVEGYHNRQIFLNRKLISDKLIDIQDIQTKAAEFIIQMTGVQDVTTSHNLLHDNWNNRVDDIRRGYHRKLSGDLLIEIQPGWEIVYEDVANTRDYVRNNAIESPLFFFGKNIKPAHIIRPVKATAVAPTVARILRIRSPNAADNFSLPELR